MPDYFSALPQQVEPTRAVAESWIGTPFRKHSCVKGPFGGVDCGGYVGAVFAAVGAIPATIALPPYHINHADHCAESVLLKWFEGREVRARVRRLDEAEAPLPFDLVFPKVGQSEHHLALWFFSEIFHVVRPGGVCRQSIRGLELHGAKLSRIRFRLLVSAVLP